MFSDDIAARCIYQVPFVEAFGIPQVKTEDLVSLRVAYRRFILCNQNFGRGKTMLVYGRPQELRQVAPPKMKEAASQLSLPRNGDAEKLVPFAVLALDCFEEPRRSLRPLCVGQEIQFAEQIV